MLHQMEGEGDYINKQNNKNIFRSNIKPDLLFYGKKVTKMFLGKQLSWEGNKHEPLNCCACVELTKQCFAFLPGLWTLLDYKNVHCHCHSVKAGNLRTLLKRSQTNLLLSVVFLAFLELNFCWQLLSMAMCDTSALWSLLLARCFSRLKQRCWLWPTKP